MRVETLFPSPFPNTQYKVLFQACHRLFISLNMIRELNYLWVFYQARSRWFTALAASYSLDYCLLPLSETRNQPRIQLDDLLALTLRTTVKQQVCIESSFKYSLCVEVDQSPGCYPSYTHKETQTVCICSCPWLVLGVVSPQTGRRGGRFCPLACH